MDNGWLAQFCIVPFLVGSLIWLTGHYPCTAEPQREYRQTFQHDGENVAQKQIDFPLTSVKGSELWTGGWRRAVKRGGWIATGLGSVWFVVVQILDNLARLSMARDIVTACSERVDCRNAVHHRNLIELTASVISTGRNSMTVCAEGRFEGRFELVALDKEVRPAPVKTLTTEGPKES